MKFFLLALMLAVLAPAAPAQEPGTRSIEKKSEKRASVLPVNQRARADRIRMEAFADPFDEDKLSAFMALLPKDGDLYVVEGDLLLTAQELQAYVVTKSQTAGAVDRASELIVNVHRGQRDYYREVSQRDLTYAVDRQSFPDQDLYAKVIDNMKVAGKDWVDACAECKIQFRHVQEADLMPSHERVNFVVRYRDTNGAYVAAGFFPHDGPSRRYLNIDPSYFSTEFDRAGVLRHELGHILGYRHEQTRDVAGCYYEDRRWLPLTEYDPRSVMHYYCGGGGSLSLQLTDLDRAGHRKLYGLETPEAPKLLRVRIDGEDIASSVPRVLQTLQDLGMLNTQIYKVRSRGETLQSVFKNTLKLPVYSDLIQRYALRLNEGRVGGGSLRVGAEVVHPEVNFEVFEKIVLLDLRNSDDKKTYKGIKAVWPKELLDETKLDQKSVALTLKGLELNLAFGSAEERRKAVAALTKARQTYNADYLVSVTSEPKSDPSYQAAPFFSYPGGGARAGDGPPAAVAPAALRPEVPRRTPNQFYDRYLESGKKLDAGEEGDLSLVLGQHDDFESTGSCTTNCPEIILMDTPVFRHPDLGAAVNLSATGPPVTSPIDAEKKQNLIIEGDDIDKQMHGTHLAGIIGSQPNGFGLVGVHPKAEILSLDWSLWEDKPEELKDFINERLRDRQLMTSDKRLQIFVFATEWSYQNEEFGTDEARFQALSGGVSSPWSELAKTIQDMRPLIIAAAGQPETEQGTPKPISRRTPKGPRNLADLHGVIVVTAYDNEDTARGLKVWPRSNFHADLKNKFIHVAAPGVRILSTVPNRTPAAHYRRGTGTSQATAFVAGVVSHMVSAWPRFYTLADVVKTRLQVTSNPHLMPEEAGKLAAGVVDFNMAMRDPEKIWFKPSGEDLVKVEEKDFKWLVDAFNVTDGENPPVRIETRHIYRLVYKDDIFYIYTVGQKVGEIKKYGPVKLSRPADMRGLKLFEIKKPGVVPSPQYTLSGMSDLILSKPIKSGGNILGLF